jgi:hypothetical protein
MYAAIRKYTIKPNFIDEVMQRIQGGFLHIISRELGITAYYAVRVGNNEVLTISVFACVNKNLDGFIQGEPQTKVGWVFGSSFGPVSDELCIQNSFDVGVHQEHKRGEE